MLQWRTLTPSTSRAADIKGAELAAAIIPGALSRFQLIAIRAYDAERMPDQVYMVRDADTVTDAQVREGVRPAIVWRGKSEEEGIAWAMGQIGKAG